VAQVAACVSDRPIIASPDHPGSLRSAVSFAPFGSIARLRRRGGGSLGLFLRCDVEPIQAALPRPSFRSRLIGYAYQITDAEDRELLAFHWHPDSVSPVTGPHLHLTSRIGRIEAPRTGSAIALGQVHIPTGTVNLADVIRLLIGEFDVEPRRPDWQAILAAADSEASTSE
jgi:hypothetical protein